MTLLSAQTTSKRVFGGVSRAATTLLEWAIYSVLAFALLVGIAVLMGSVGNAFPLGFPDAVHGMAAVVVFIGLSLYDKFA